MSLFSDIVSNIFVVVAFHSVSYFFFMSNESPYTIVSACIPITIHAVLSSNSRIIIDS